MKWFKSKDNWALIISIFDLILIGVVFGCINIHQQERIADLTERIADLTQNQTKLQEQILTIEKNQEEISKLTAVQQEVTSLYNKCEDRLKTQKSFINCSYSCCVTNFTYKKNIDLFNKAFEYIQQNNYYYARTSLEKMNLTTCYAEQQKIGEETKARAETKSNTMVWVIIGIIVVLILTGIGYGINKKK